MLDQIIEAKNIKFLRPQVAKIQGLERLSLWQRLIIPFVMTTIMSVAIISFFRSYSMN